MQQIRKLPPEQGEQVKAIALTAYASELEWNQALSIGFQQHISKPIEPEALLRTIVMLLERTAPAQLEPELPNSGIQKLLTGTNGRQKSIAKPIEPQKLMQAMSALCDSTETWQEPNFQGVI